MEKAVLDKPQAANSMVPRVHYIRRVTKETYDTFTIELEPVERDGFRFAPGQFNMLYVFGVGEAPISICGDPTKPETLVHTIRSVGTVTEALSKLKRWDVVGVRGPFGSSWPVKEAEGNDVVIAAGGIGLPPVRPVMYHILANREKYGKVILLYGARTPQDLLYTRELERWRSHLDLQVEVTVDSSEGNWRGNVGVVTKLIPGQLFDPNHTIVMMVGPEVMMRFTIMEFQKRGVSDDRIYVSMERNMKCAVGMCGHCQFGPEFICKDGPVFPYSRLSNLFGKREI